MFSTSAFDTGFGCVILAAATTSMALPISCCAHAQPLESGRQADADIKIVKPARRIGRAKRTLDPRHRLGRRGGVEADRIGRCHRVRLRVIEIEPLPHALRHGVFEPDLGAEIRGEPGAVERIGARGKIARILHDARQARAEQADGFLGHGLHHRIGVDAVEAFHRMRHGVHAARRRHARRQIERQFRIVDRGRRQRRRIVFAQHTLVGNADIPTRRHFRAGIGGDDGDIRQPRRCRRGFAKPDRRAAADHDKAVGVVLLDGRQACARTRRAACFGRRRRRSRRSGRRPGRSRVARNLPASSSTARGSARSCDARFPRAATRQRQRRTRCARGRIDR